RQAQPAVVQEEKPQGVVKVLVAGRTINPGEILAVKDVTWAEWPKALVEERMINENEFVVPSATVPPTQVGLVVRTEEGDTKKKPEGDEEQQSAKSGPADSAIVGARSEEHTS